MARGRAIVALLAALAASCGARLPKLPSGPGELAADMAAAVAEAMSGCGKADRFTAEISVSGSVAGQRLRARLLGGFSGASARLEAVSPAGPPFFIFVANGRDATLVFPRDERVLPHGQSDDVLEAIAGVRLFPSELREMLIGCAMPGKWTAAFSVADNWRVGVGEHGSKIYLKRDSPDAPWHMSTLLYPGEGLQWSWRADYSDFHDGLPHSIHLVSADPKRFDLQVRLAQLEPGAPLDADAFRVRIPPSAQPITIDELRRSGPLGQKSDGR